MKIVTYLIIFMINLAGFHTVWAQEEVSLTLDEVIELALKQNHQLQIAETNVSIAAANHQSTRSVFLPNIGISETVTSTNDPLASFGYKLKQKNTSLADFNPEVLNDPKSTSNFNTQIQFQQPILNLSGLYQRRSSALQLEATENSLQWVKNTTIITAKKLYFDLVLAKREISVINKLLNAARSTFQIATDLFEQGILLEHELLASRLRVKELETQLLAVNHAFLRSGLNMGQFLGMANVKIIPETNVALLPYDEERIQSLEISSNRPDLASLGKALDAQKQLWKSAKSGFMPELVAFGHYEWNDPDFIGITADNYLVGAKFQWTLFNGGRTLSNLKKMEASAKQTKIQLDQAQSAETIKLILTKNEAILARKQIYNAEASLDQAEKAYEIIKDRFSEGLESVSTLLNAETVVEQKEQFRLQKINEYNQSIFKLELLSGKQLIN